MKIENHFIEEMTIEEFADQHDLIMEVHERRWPGPGFHRFYAHFKNAEIKLDGFLSGRTGDGNTPEDAIAQYSMEISNKVLVIDAYKETRKEIQVPKLISKRAKEAK